MRANSRTHALLASHACAPGGDALPQGRFQRKSTVEPEERPGELSAAIARAKSGDHGALRYLYLRFSGNVYGLALGILHDEHEAEDVTQQVFTRVMTAIANYEERSVPFTGWLLRITQNLAIDHIRRRRSVPCEDVEPGPGRDHQRGREIAASLRSALAELPEQQRQVVVLRHVSGLSPGEIAERLGTSEDAVHGLHHRGRRRLKHALAELEAMPVVAAA